MASPENGRHPRTSVTPVAQADASARRPSMPSDVDDAPALGVAAQDLHVLLVDDHAINRKVVQLFLRPLGLRVTEAHDGAQALRQLAEHRFDLVLMDVHMPVMGGCEAVALIRSSGADWADIPVVALTADAMPSDQRRYLMAGMNGYVAKPFQQRDLFDAMTRALELRMAHRAA